MDVAGLAIKPIKEFAKDSYRLVKRCTKPDRKGAPAKLRTRAVRSPRARRASRRGSRRESLVERSADVALGLTPARRPQSSSRLPRAPGWASS
jgi:hypothetical protein